MKLRKGNVFFWRSCKMAEMNLDMQPLVNKTVSIAKEEKKA